MLYVLIGQDDFSRHQSVQEIKRNNRDLLAEGFVGLDGIAFIRVWDSLNAKRGYSWASNPWVWVISYKLLSDG